MGVKGEVGGEEVGAGVKGKVREGGEKGGEG